MTGSAHADDTAEPDLPERVRRRLDDVFGDVLPAVTRDEVGDPQDDGPPAWDDDWLRANRPPHHDQA